MAWWKDMIERRQIVGLERIRRFLGVGLCLMFDFIDNILDNVRPNKLLLSI